MVQAAKTEATRAALGPTLVRLAREGLDIVCVDADLGVSTSAVKFGREFPDRFFPVGVAEQNMIGAAAGPAPASSPPPRPVPWPAPRCCPPPPRRAPSLRRRTTSGTAAWAAWWPRRW